MIDKTIDRMKISIEDILSEIDTKQLIVIDFLLRKRSEIPEQLLNNTNFYDIVDILGINFQEYKNETREKLIEDILDINKCFPEQNYLKCIYTGDKNTNNPLINRIIDTVEFLFFSKKLSDFDITEEDDDFLKDFFQNYCYKNKEVLNVLGLLLLYKKVNSSNYEITLPIQLNKILNEEIIKEIYIHYINFSYNKFKEYENKLESLSKRAESGLSDSQNKEHKINSLKEELKKQILIF